MTGAAAIADPLARHLDAEAAVALLRGAVAAESITGNEAAMAAFLAPEMARRGLQPEQADFLPGRPNIWGAREGAGSGPRLLFMGHTDTVHVRGWAERWAGDARANPFGGAIVDGALWGRGSADLKAGICASLAALDVIDAAGLRLAGSVSFAFVGDEESGEPGTGISAGARAYAGQVQAGALPRPDFAVYVEPTRLQVFPAQMGFFIADIAVRGRSAYFGMPERGVDALKAAHRVLAALWAHSDEVAARAGHPLVGRAFLLVTGIEGGGYIAVPGECRLSLIRKLLPGESLDAAAAEMEAVIRTAAAQEGITIYIAYPAGRDHALGGSPCEIDATLPAVGALQAALAGAAPGAGGIEGAPFWAEMPFIVNAMGCPAVYCAPGDISCCHTAEERVEIAEYLAGIVAFARFIITCCGTVDA